MLSFILAVRDRSILEAGVEIQARHANRVSAGETSGQEADTTCVSLFEIPSPIVSAPQEIDPAQIAQVALQFLGMSANDAANFTQTVDWTSTLVLPVVRGESKYEQVHVNGNEGALLRAGKSEPVRPLLSHVGGQWNRLRSERNRRRYYGNQPGLAVTVESQFAWQPLPLMRCSLGRPTEPYCRPRSDPAGLSRRGLRVSGSEWRWQKHFDQDAAWPGEANRWQRSTAWSTGGHTRGAKSHWLSPSNISASMIGSPLPELILFHGRLCGLGEDKLRRKIPRLLERVGLGAQHNKPIRSFSKGMMQRVGLAQAIVNDPEILFLDEPTSGLDPAGRKLVREVIAEQCSRGATVFLNSHLLGEVEQSCDRVAFSGWPHDRHV